MITRIIFVSILFFLLSFFNIAFTQNDSVLVKIFVSKDSTEVLVSSETKTFYFNNDANRLCFSYSIPGEWFGGGEGWLLSKDGQSSARVWLHSAKELKGQQELNLINRAAKLWAEDYERQIGKPLSPTLVPFQSSRSGAMKWILRFPYHYQGRELQAHAFTVFYEIAPGWLAEITAKPKSGSESDSDSLARAILNTLGTGHETGCNWPYISNVLLPTLRKSKPPSYVATTWSSYYNPNFKWSISYPKDWTLDTKILENVHVKFKDAYVSITSLLLSGAVLRELQLSHPDSLEDFVESSLSYDKRYRDQAGKSFAIISRKSTSLQNGVPAIDVVVEIGPGGKSHRRYTLIKGLAMIVDTETYLYQWNYFNATYEQIINSFIRNK